MRVQEFQPKKLVIFDIDDTLVHTQTKVNVVKDGQVTKELNSHDFTHYKLQPGEQFDFENFRNAHDFFHNSKPIIPMMDQLKNDIATGNKVVMVTARADFDDRELFLDTFRKYGVDIDRVHVYRAGNMTGKMQTEEKKKIIIRKLLNQGQYTKAIMYDDAVPNLDSFVELKDEYPRTKFYAWHVSLDGEASEYHRTNENFADGRNLQESVNDYLWHGSKSKHDILYPQQANDTGGKKESNKNAVYATPSAKVAIAMGLTTPGSDTGMFPNDPQMVLFKGGIRKSQMIYLHKVPKDLFIKHNDREWYSKPDVKEVKPIEVVTVPVDKWLHLIRQATPQDLELQKKYMKEGVTENFADGRNPQDKGDSKRLGVPTKASVSTLRKVAKQGGRKGQLAHWLANMKAGKGAD